MGFRVSGFGFEAQGVERRVCGVEFQAQGSRRATGERRRA